jgi:hypothetical protein
LDQNEIKPQIGFPKSRNNRLTPLTSSFYQFTECVYAVIVQTMVLRKPLLRQISLNHYTILIHPMSRSWLACTCAQYGTIIMQYLIAWVYVFTVHITQGMVILLWMVVYVQASFLLFLVKFT